MPSNTDATTQFRRLLDLADTLLGENGCPWDIKQTYQTLRSSLLEESYEVLDAIDKGDIPNLNEELGDLLYNVIFLAKIGEKQGDFTMNDVCKLIHDKLIARHPHIFGDKQAKDADEVLELWNEVKQQEKKRENVLDGIPKHLPALSRGYKLAARMKREEEASFTTSEELGEKLWKLTCQARMLKVDPEAALRTKLHEEEACYRLSKKKD